jgi:urea transport system ATP-binding protein
MRAIIGPNGAGKTTMMDIITGKTKARYRRGLFDGRTDLTKLDEAEIANLGIGRKFQKPTVFESHTVEDNLVLALAGLRNVFAALFHADTGGRTERIDEILTTIRLDRARKDMIWRPISVMARSSGSRSACCWRRTRSCCWSTSRWPA